MLTRWVCAHTKSTQGWLRTSASFCIDVIYKVLFWYIVYFQWWGRWYWARFLFIKVVAYWRLYPPHSSLVLVVNILKKTCCSRYMVFTSLTCKITVHRCRPHNGYLLEIELFSSHGGVSFSSIISPSLRYSSDTIQQLIRRQAPQVSLLKDKYEVKGLG